MNQFESSSNRAVDSKRFRRRALLAGLVLGGLGLVVLNVEPAQRLPDGVQAVPVDFREIVVEVRAQGVLRAQGQQSVYPEGTGVVVRLSPEALEGGRVEAGDWVFRLDATEAQAALDEAEAALLAAEAERSALRVRHARAAQERDRAARLYREQLIPRDERDQARVAFDELEAQLRVVDAQIEQARVRRDRAADGLDQTWIRAPVSGELLNVFATPGQPVVRGSSEPLFTIAPDLGRLELVLDVSEIDIGRLSRGQRVRFQVDAHPGRTFEGTVTRVHAGGQRRSGATNYEVIVGVEPTAAVLLPGMSVQARVDTGALPETRVIPLRALLYRPSEDIQRREQLVLDRLRAEGRAVVWVRMPDRSIQPVGVNLGEQDDEFVALDSTWPFDDDVRVLMRE
ncbi:MAG: efflux RND transporter periplasmic adaptor subunit [Thioalkalivibrionaceae bacterium]